MIFRLLQLYAILVPFETLWWDLYRVNTILKPYRIVGIAVIFLSILRAIAGSKPLRVDFYDKGFLFLLLWGVFTAVFWFFVKGDGNMDWMINDAILILFGYFIYLSTKRELDTFHTAERLLTAYIVGIMASIVLRVMFFEPLTTGRFASFYANPNGLGVALAASFVVILSRMLFKRDLSIRSYLIRGSLLLGIGVVVFFTGSKGAAVGLIAGVVALFLPLARRGGKVTFVLRAAAVAPFVIIMIGVISAAYNTYDDSEAVRRYKLATGSTDSRMDIWESAMNVAADHYFMGIGVAQYRWYHVAYVHQLDVLRSPKVAERDLVTHSEYVNLITEYGLPVVLVYIFMLVNLYRRLLIAIRTTPVGAPFLAEVLGMISALLVIAAAHIMIAAPDFWLLMAIATSASLSTPESRGKLVKLARGGKGVGPVGMKRTRR